MAGSLLEERSARLDRAKASLGEPRALSRGSGWSVPAVGEQTFPLAAPLRSVLPDGGLRRGSTVEVGRSTSLVLALLAEASAEGAWCALVGLPEVGLVAAAEAGLALSRVALVPHPGPDLVAITAALLDGLDLVVVAGGQRLPADARQRLAARARHAGSVLLPIEPWPGADVRLGVQGGRWHGLGGAGAGRLRCRQVRVRGSGRGSAHRERSATLLLPGPDGAVAGVERVPPVAVSGVPAVSSPVPAQAAS